MINNYVKNDVLIPPVRKKYGMDHMILLLMVYYLKSYLSIGDIGQVLKPLQERYAGNGAGKGDELSLEMIYRTVYENLGDELEAVRTDADRQFERARKAFPDAEGEDAAVLRKFALIARMRTEIYLKKLFIERLLDDETQDR